MIGQNHYIHLTYLQPYQRLAKRIDLTDFVREIELKCWDRLAKLYWRPFEAARAFARSLKLKNETEWRKFSKGGMPRLGRLPADIPASPYKVYTDKGWTSMGDWLGTDTIAPRLREYRTFLEARAFVHNLKLKSGGEWYAYCNGKMPLLGRRPADIPSNPNLTYANKGWAGRGDWLGTGNVASFLKLYRPFKRARAFARSLKLNSEAEWRAFCKGEMPQLEKLPADIPANPNQTYAQKGWKSLGDWLGTGTIAPRLREYRSFREARAFVRKLKLKSRTEWVAFCRGEMSELGELPPDIPAKPDNTYANEGWKGMGDWLGTGTIAPRLRTYRSFYEARAYARTLHLKTGIEWKKFCEGNMPEKGTLPPDIPLTPGQTYAKNGWAGVGDWLGTGAIANFLRQYRSFEEARTFARSLGLKSGTEWTKFCKGNLPEIGKLPDDIPTIPRKTYANKGWKSMGDWLGTGTVATYLKKYRAFPAARAFARRLNLESQTKWFAFCKGNIPEKGTLPSDIPVSVHVIYANKGWAGFADWLGTGRTRVSKSPNRKS
ncbi:MAG: hypothetical protein ABI600_05865, partial [Luteolibacter sp.]